MVKPKTRLPGMLGVNVKRPAAKERASSSPAAAAVSQRGHKGQQPTCSGCTKVITEDTKALQCDKCMSNDIWKCISCLHLTDDIYDHLVADSKIPLKWSCENCDQEIATKGQNPITQTDKLDQLITSIEKLMGRYDKLERKLKDKCDTSKVQYLADRLDSVEDHLKEKCNVEWVAQIEDRMKDFDDRFTRHEQIMQDKVTTPAKSMEEVRKVDSDLNRQANRAAKQKETSPNVDENVAELRERERRKNNIIVFNIEESSKDNSEERKQDDKAAVHDILFELNIATELSNPVRLGPKRDGSSYPRPMRITDEDETMKWNVLKEAKNLRNAREEALKKVYTKKNMTPLEREKDAELRKQLLEKKKQVEEAQDQSKWII